MLKVAIYPSNHGFGHATRMSALALELNKFGIFTFIRTDRPEYLYDNLSTGFYSVSISRTDFGVVHGSQLITDLEATRSRLLKLMSQRLEIIDQEVSFLRENEIDLVIADIPFFICEAASYAGIPVFAISNFDWFFIYHELFEADREMRAVINSIYGLYARVDQAYRLPFSSTKSMRAFPALKKVGLLARMKEGYQDIRKRHDLDPQKPILLAFHSGVGDIDMGMDKVANCFKGYTITNIADSRVKDAITIPQHADMLDYVFSADLILTKPGYSTLAEAVQFGKPILFRPRNNYPEERVLIDGLKKYPLSCCIDDPRRLGAEVEDFIKRSCREHSGKALPAFRNRNAEIAALIYQDFFRIRYSGKKLVSVFDAGSNNLNYCVYEPGWDRIVHKTQLPTGLGRGFVNDKLAPSSIRSFLRALGHIYAFDKEVYSDKHIIATGVSRKARNVATIKELVRKKFNLKYGVITPRDEAYYVFSAIRDQAQYYQTVVAFDIGGNSTEIIVTANDKHRKWVSLPLGLLRMIETDANPDLIVDEYALELDSIGVDNVSALVGVGLTVELIERLILPQQKPSGEWGRLDRKVLEDLQNDLSKQILSMVSISEKEKQDLSIFNLSVRLLILFMDKYGTQEILVCKDGISVGFAKAKTREIRS
ncbi:MAG TPA: hypothetical protein PL124_01505 [Candidatus Cloacimonadota bacterium]|nr:hypothetical protein [Candidatus Cloacimonadota bacterium]